MRIFSFVLCLVMLLLLAAPGIYAQEPAPFVENGAQSTVPAVDDHRVYIPSIAVERTLFYVDGSQGDDSNPGTQKSPWRSVEHAIATIKSGSTVIIYSGIYRVDSLRFGPAGKGFDQLTIFQAAPGERVIFTRPDNTPPSVGLADFVRLEGFWFGGKWESGNPVIFGTGGSPIGRGKQLVNNTIFGYPTGISQGSAEYILYQGNRLVLNGDGKYKHPIYLSSGGPVGSRSQHAIVDNNIFIGGEGWAIHCWHGPHNNIVTRNFVAGHYHSLVMDGSDHLVAHNFFWRPEGEPGQIPYAAWLPGSNIVTVNNVFAHAIGIVAAGPSATIRNNAFLNSPPVGESAVVFDSGEEETQFGISAQELDQAIASLENAFSQSVEQIYADESIETEFAKLKLVIPGNSTIHRRSHSWYDPDLLVNIGPDAPSPDTLGKFWEAFRGLGFQEYDRFGNIIQP